MKLRKQKHENGCVPACLATISDITYNKALSIFKKRDWDKRGVSYQELYFGLRRLDLEYEILNKSFIETKSKAIIIVAHQRYGPPGKQLHAVIWTGSKILDPYFGQPMSMTEYKKSTVKTIIIKKL